MGGTEVDGNQGGSTLQYSTAATVEVIMMLQFMEMNRWMNGWMDGDELMDDDDYDDVEVVIVCRLVSCTYTTGMMQLTCITIYIPILEGVERV